MRSALLRPLAALACAVFAGATLAAEPLTGTLKKLADSRQITLGYRIDAAPFSFQAPDGTPSGYSVDLCRRVVASLQAQLKLAQLAPRWVPVTAADRVDRVLRGDVDLECGTTSATLARMEQVDFSSLIFVDSSSFITQAGGPRRLADLAGKRVGVLAGSTSEARLSRALASKMVSAQVVRLGSGPEAVRALVDGRIDAFANDRLALIGRIMLSQPDGVQFALAEEDFALERYALMMRRDPALRLAVNRALAQIYGGPVLEELYGAWFAKFGKPSPLLASMFVLHALDE